jgi:hypothetical protein
VPQLVVPQLQAPEQQPLGQPLGLGEQRVEPLQPVLLQQGRVLELELELRQVLQDLVRLAHLLVVLLLCAALV